MARSPTGRASPSASSPTASTRTASPTHSGSTPSLAAPSATSATPRPSVPLLQFISPLLPVLHNDVNFARFDASSIYMHRFQSSGLFTPKIRKRLSRDSAPISYAT